MPYDWAMCGGFRLSRIVLMVLAGIASLGSSSCAPPAISGDFDSPHPAARLFAARRAAAQTDPAAARDAIPGLIRNLDSDDPAVRLVSIEALYELTGETYGYKHYDPEWMRAETVRRWAQAWEHGEVALRNGLRVGPDTLPRQQANERAASGG